MISRELLLAAPRTAWSIWTPEECQIFSIGDEWIGSGVWIARGEGLGDLATEKKPEKQAHIEKMLAGERVDVVEDETLRLPFVAGLPKVSEPCPGECDGGTVECNLGHEHDCDECDGNGEIVSKKGTPDDLGQRVYVGGGVTTVVQARLGVLLEGYKVVRFGTRGRDMLGGVDADGKVVVVVAPMLTDVRRTP